MPRVARERFQRRAMLAVADDHHACTVSDAAQDGERLQRFFEAATCGELADHGHELRPHRFRAARARPPSGENCRDRSAAA